MGFIFSKEEFEKELEEIGRKFPKKVLCYTWKIEFCREVLENYRKEIQLNDFPNLEAEVIFFKEQKQIPQANLIYFLHLQAYEVELQGIGEFLKSNFITTKIEESSSFLSSNLDLVQYMELEQSHLDEYYFTRRFSTQSFSSRRSYFRDPTFSTSHDLLLSEINAYQRYLSFLQSELRRQQQPLSASFEEPKLQWTSPKVDLTELIYALHQSGSINNGSASLKDLVSGMERLMGIELGDYHHTFLRLRERSKPVKFLDKLREHLNERMQDLDA